MPNVNWPADFLDAKVRVASTPYLYMIAEGKVPGHAVGIALGERTNVSTSVFEDLDSGFGAEPHTPSGARIVSSSASDTAAGTGAQKVLLEYLDANWIEKYELVTLNGTTPVTLAATDIVHIQELEVAQVGSGGFAAGNIDLQNPAGTVTWARIAAGTNVYLNARYHVPAGKTLFIVEWTASAFNGAAKFHLDVEHAHPGGGKVFHTMDAIQVEKGAVNPQLLTPLRVEEKSHVQVRARAKGAATDAVARFGFLVEDA